MTSSDGPGLAAAFVATPDRTLCVSGSYRPFCTATSELKIGPDQALDIGDSADLTEMLAEDFEHRKRDLDCTGQLLLTVTVAAENAHDEVAARRLQTVLAWIQIWLDRESRAMPPVFVKAFTVEADKELAAHEVVIRAGIGSEKGIAAGVAVTRPLSRVEADLLRDLFPMPKGVRGFHMPRFLFDVFDDGQPSRPLASKLEADPGLRPCTADDTSPILKKTFLERLARRRCVGPEADSAEPRGWQIYDAMTALCKPALAVASRVPGAQCSLGLGITWHFDFSSEED